MADLGRFSSRERLIRANTRPIKIRPPYNRLYVAVLASVAGIGGFLFGYDTGVVSGAMILLKDDFELSVLWQELIVSVTIGAAAIAALVGGILNDRFGRRPVIIASSIVFASGSLVLGFVPQQDKQILLIGRIIVGVGIGLASMTVPMYIAEASPSHVRGRLVTVNTLFITSGQLVASIVDGFFSKNTENGWRYMLGLAALPAILQLIGLMFLHESPRWLVIHGQYQDAKKVLGKIYGENNYGEEFESIRTSVEEIKNAEHGGKTNLLKKIFKDSRVRQALIVGCGLQMFQQLAGINTVMYYSATIIHMAGIKGNSVVIWLAAAVSSVNFTFTLVGLLLIDRLGRRKLAIISMAGVCLCHVFLGASFLLSSMVSPTVDVFDNSTQCGYQYSTCDGCILNQHCGFCYEEFNGTISDGACILGDQKNSTSCDTNWAFDYCPSPFAFLAVVGMVLYLMFFAPGMGPIPWMINSEIYPQWARSTCNSFSTFTNWTFNLVISMTFLSLTEAITRQGTFFLYAGISALGLIFIITLLPETKGKRLENIQRLFDQPCVLCATDNDTPDVRYVRVTPHRDANGSDEVRQHLLQEENEDDDNDDEVDTRYAVPS